MNKLLIIASIFLVSHISNAQLFKKEKVLYDGNQGKGSTDNNLFRWGYYLGLNSYDFNFDYKEDLQNDILVENSVGFNVGLIGNIRLSNFLDLRFEPGLIVNTRNLEYNPSHFETIPRKSDLTREVKSTYIHLPLLLKISTKRVNNFKPFIVGGFSTAINLSSNEKNPEDNQNRQFRSISNPLFYELGFGIDFYLHNFKFTPSIRGIFSLDDELIRDKDPNSPWTSHIENMKTRGIFINFTFQ